MKRFCNVEIMLEDHGGDNRGAIADLLVPPSQLVYLHIEALGKSLSGTRVAVSKRRSTPDNANHVCLCPTFPSFVV